MKYATFICGGELVPASRYRVHPIEAALSENGWNTKVINGYGSFDNKINGLFAQRVYRITCRTRRAFQTAFLDRKGPVMVQRLALPWFGSPEARLARQNRKLVFDFDDAVFLGGNGRESKLRRKALDIVLANAAHVVTGNSWLAQIVPTDIQYTVIPTCIDTRRYCPAIREERKGPVRVGWIGTSSNIPYLRQLVEPLAKLRRKGLDYEMAICSDREDVDLFKRLGASFHKWSADIELPFLQSLDIGVMPLDDTDWCRGKCSFKMILYMAMGCPVVASAVGMNKEVLSGNVGGRLVVDEAWVEPLQELLESPGLRREVGANARKRAVERYDISVSTRAYKKIFEELQ